MCLPTVHRVLLASLFVFATACDDKKEDKPADSAAKSDGEAGDDGGSSKSEKKKKDDDEDKGNANLMLGDEEWGVDRCSAKVKDGKLRISASRMERIDGKMSREALTISVPDFNGTGEYTLNNANTNFTGVGLSTKAIEDAKGDEKAANEAVTKAATKAIGGSTVVLMMGAKVKIESAGDDYIDGTIDWSGATTLRGPSSVSGKFHARVMD